MRQTARTARATAPAGGRSGAARDTFVIFAMSLVVLALGFYLHLQLDIARPFAVVAGATAWVALLSFHLAVRRRSRAPAAAEDELGRLSNEIANIKQAAGTRSAASPVRPGRTTLPTQASAPVKPPPLPPAARAQTDSARQPHLGQAVLATSDRPEPRAAGHAPHGPSNESQLPLDIGWDLRPGVSPEQLAPASRPAAFQSFGGASTTPAAPAQAPQRREQAAPERAAATDAHAPMTGQAGGAASIAPEARAGDARDKSAELRSMQSLIEQIARQLTTPPEAPAAPIAGESAQPVAAEQAITQSVEALKTAGNAMRAAAAGAAPDPTRPIRERSSLTTNTTASPQIAEAISAQRLDTYLDYIFRLEDRKAHLFEISVRIRTEDGRSHGLADCAPLLASGGLHGRLDAARLTLLAKIGERLNSRGTNASLFSSLAPRSLIDDVFLDTCANVLRNQPAVGRQLVLSFAQSDVRSFTKPHWETLTTLAENGARFAVEDAVDVAMDLDMLKSRGFGFIRTDATVLLTGMQTRDGLASAAQTCKLLAEAGLGLIVRAIHDEATLAQVSRLGVPYGQGALFGAARPVRIDLKQPREAAA